MKQKHLAVALSAIFAAAALTGCGSDSDSNFNYQPEVPETPETPEVPETPETPDVPDTEDNVGDAASGIENLNATATVGGQQYVRGPKAEFDRTLNPTATGNETVLNSKRLQNEKLDNILVGRETVQRLDQNEAVLRLAGEAVDGFSDNSSANTAGLQEYNGSNSTPITITRNKPNFSATGNTQYYDADGNAVAGVKFEYNPNDVAGTSTNPTSNPNVTVTPNGYPLYASNGQPLLEIGTNKPLYLVVTADTSTTVAGNDIQVNNTIVDPSATPGNPAGSLTSSNADQRGLVGVRRQTDGSYNVFGQEDTTGTRPGVNANGSSTSTRIFGNKYRDVTNAASANSYRFVKGLENGEYKDIDANTGSIETIKLNHVQYGRVTSNIDKLNPVATIGKDGTLYYQSEIVAKDNTATNPNVDTYFYRGTGETSVDNMTAFFKDQGNIDKGTVSYAGHAVMYGIDNTFHGNQGNPDTNAPGATDLAIAGGGNFVQANVDINERKINGSIFNVWGVAPGVTTTPTKFVKDDLVRFEGKINGNTAKGESQLAYGSEDKGAFKGSFFGPNAEEFGGSVNSIDDGRYGKAAWGGVFGTQKVEGAPIIDGNANQTE